MSNDLSLKNIDMIIILIFKHKIRSYIKNVEIRSVKEIKMFNKSIFTTSSSVS